MLDCRVVDCGLYLEERDDRKWYSLLGLGLQVEHVSHRLSKQFMIVGFQGFESHRLEFVVKVLLKAYLQSNGHSVELEVLFKL